ncbi:MAG: glycogen synthase GlgA [Desulfuromonadaceae bacterium]
MRILFATSEIYPLAKTGGLADVAAGLSTALQRLNHEVTVILPAYLDVIEQLDSVYEVAHIGENVCGIERRVRILRAESDSGVNMLLVDIPGLFDRAGNPYQDEQGNDWWDNGERFGLFSRVVARAALNQLYLDWVPDVVHCNDWQTGLVPAFMRLFVPDSTLKPQSVFTIHNLSYSGKFPYSLFAGLGLPDAWWNPDMLEFYGEFSMLKAGLVCAENITTVSPTYAAEICTPAGGFGFEGVLQQCAAQGRLSGIINGIDTEVWNPARDPYIAYPYSVEKGRVAQKKRNKQHVLQELAPQGVSVDVTAPLMGSVGRMVEQKGSDLLLKVIEPMVEETDANFVILGSGEKIYEHGFTQLARRYPGRVFVRIGYAEDLAHQIEAGADMFLMPSRFEPCGLNQMYSLTYGTPPIVHATGGLKDTVVDASPESLATGGGTGFVMQEATTAELHRCLERAVELYRRPRAWQKLQKNAMLQDFGWQRSAEAYLEIYQSQI